MGQQPDAVDLPPAAVEGNQVLEEFLSLGGSALRFDTETLDRSPADAIRRLHLGEETSPTRVSWAGCPASRGAVPPWPTRCRSPGPPVLSLRRLATRKRARHGAEGLETPLLPTGKGMPYGLPHPQKWLRAAFHSSPRNRLQTRRTAHLRRVPDPTRFCAFSRARLVPSLAPTTGPSPSQHRHRR